MPGPLRSTYHKAEAKYNVTTEFPSLGLHSAAATGNVGLVEYALDHGQPINSVLDGVLPLHAACAGGNVQVVKLLIDHGADVNAPRLPRRYSNDKNRDSSAPIVGTSGSTPLHFAAANGNTDAVNLLLLHGAHANRADKHGVTPEMLARQNGWLECADVLKQWLVNKDRDLRERPGGRVADDARSIGAGGSSTRERLGSFSADGEPPASSPARRRIHVKQSIDTALNKLKSSASDTKQPLPSLSTQTTSTPPASPSRPLGEYTFHPVPASDDEYAGPIDGSGRRPSLPHILPPASIGTSRSRKTSTPTLNNSPSPRRPRSAGTGAENQEQELNYSPSGRSGVKRLGSKYSLMNLFKKAQPGESGHTPDVAQSSLGMTPVTSGSATGLLLSAEPDRSMSPSHPSLNNATNELTSPSTVSISSLSRTGFRFHRGSDASTRTPPQPLQGKASAITVAPPRVTVPSAVDLHNALAQDRQERQNQRQTRDRSRSTGSGARFIPDENINTSPTQGSSPLTRIGLLRAQGHKRDRSGSGGSLGTGYRSGAVFDDDVVVVPTESTTADVGKSGPRPSILKAHARTSSSGHVPGTPSGFRALRFDSSSSGGSGRRADGDAESSAVQHTLRATNSVGSLGKYRKKLGAPEPRLSEEYLAHDSTPDAISDFEPPSRSDVISGDEDDEEYGQPIINDEESPVIDPGTPLDTKSPHMALLMRERGLSFTSSSESSLSPIMSNDTPDASLIRAEFPFSINHAPPPLSPGESGAVDPAQGESLRVPPSGDNRCRGDSVSSTSTSDSRNPQLSSSGTTSGSGTSETITTPYLSSPGRDEFLHVSTGSSPGLNVEGLIEEVGADDSGIDLKAGNTNVGQTTTLNERRPRIPPDINISSISSHAQAEALVQKAQQEILEMAHSNELSPGTASTGRSPLSARLAAYGESLALERKLREQKQEEERRASGGRVTPVSSNADPFLRQGALTPMLNGHSRRDGVERQHSLENRSNRPKLRSRMKDPKRPSTAEGLSPRTNSSFSSDSTGRFHQSSLSASGFGPSPPSRLAFEDTDDLDLSPIHSKSATLLPISNRELDTSPGHSRVASRSRTPVPDTGDGHLSRISSLECPDTDTELGPSLLRVTTAPHAPVRGAKTATKLTRMGFPTIEQARATAPSGSKRFGAIRSLVQTLKGKS
ncbi:hypothetical protein Hypma_007485 [Hypsizygus marmoreus]|uniref:Uncharacterized protein n=1 Tax=Hypsizygus marmoreus TaxID=39966 RepID=A0A369JZI6_HYPMA|nr:hypothetical protein Hypma_007485 [Hypsizygus marmoreus]